MRTSGSAAPPGSASLRISGRVHRGHRLRRAARARQGVVRQLATCRWVAEHQTVIVTGATGTGKTYLACALAHQACRKGFRAFYRRVPRLFDELASRSRRRQLHAAARAHRARRRPRPRRLRDRTAHRRGAPRPPRNPRGPLRPRATIITSQLPAAKLARLPRRPDRRRRHLRSRPPPHPPSQHQGPIQAEGGRHRNLNAPNAHLTAQDGRSARSRCGDLRDQDGRNAQPDTCRAGGRAKSL